MKTIALAAPIRKVWPLEVECENCHGISRHGGDRPTNRQSEVIGLVMVAVGK